MEEINYIHRFIAVKNVVGKYIEVCTDNVYLNNPYLSCLKSFPPCFNSDACHALQTLHTSSSSGMVADVAAILTLSYF